MNASQISENSSGEASGKPIFSRFRRILLPAALVAAVSGGALLVSGSIGSSATSQEAAKAAATRILPVSSVSVTMDEAYSVEERFVGRVEAARRSDLGFELPGTLIDLSADEGETVEAGQVLAKLDTARLEAQRDELGAGLTQAKATRDLAESTYERFESASAKRSVSVQQLEEAREQRVSATSAVRRIEAQLDAVAVDLEKSVLKAPYSGTVSVRMADEGAIVNGGQPVLRILETGRLEIRAGLSRRAAREIGMGDRFEWECQSDEPVAARVVRILPQRDDQTRTVDVILAVEADSGLRDGDLIEVPVSREIQEEGAWLPRSALTESARGLWAVYVLMPGGEEAADVRRLERRQLEVIDEKGDRVFVRGAIQDGERVVDSGIHRLSPGQRVRDAGIMTDSLTRS